MSFDDGVQATNCDATKSKYSAVKMGYWQDDFIQYFVTGYERKTPEINRGYYARIKGVAMFMDKFLKVFPKNVDRPHSAYHLIVKSKYFLFYHFL